MASKKENIGKTAIYRFSVGNPKTKIKIKAIPEPFLNDKITEYYISENNVIYHYSSLIIQD